MVDMLPMDRQLGWWGHDGCGWLVYSYQPSWWDGRVRVAIEVCSR